MSTAATMASSDLDSNHTYEPIENFDNTTSSGYVKDAVPFTLIHHDGRKVTANKIVSMENLREVLQNHEMIPMEDETKEELYILAPMRLLTPILEESESDTTKSKLYQSSNTTVRSNTYSNAYSDINNSVMSIVSEVLNVWSGVPQKEARMRRSVSQISANLPDYSTTLSSCLLYTSDAADE